MNLPCIGPANRRLFVLLFVFALTACGGGGAADPTTQGVAPAIIAQPANQTVLAGASATFSVAASGDAPLSYQWQRGVVDVPGATSSTFVLGNAQTSDNGSVWSVRVSNPAGQTTSAGAILSVQPNGTITLVTGTLNLASGEARERLSPIGQGIAADGDGNLFYTAVDTVVRRSPAGDLAPITTSTLVEPLGVAVDGAGTVFVTIQGEPIFNLYQVRVLRIDSQGRVSTELRVFSIAPAGIAAGADGSYYVVAGGVRRVLPDGTVVDVTAPEVRRVIDSIAVDAGGTVYFGHDNMVKKIAPGQAEVLLAGASTEGSADGTGDQARFRFGGSKNFLVAEFRTSLAVDSVGNVYVADNGNHTIRRITPAGVVTTVAGQAGVSGLTTGPLPGKLFAPTGLALHGDKTLYVTSAGAILKIDLP